MCVTGGIFSEGIDLKNDSLIGAVIVGTGLPMICRERNILRDYFDANEKDGYSYAYVYPSEGEEPFRHVVVYLDKEKNSRY